MVLRDGTYFKFWLGFSVTVSSYALFSQLHPSLATALFPVGWKGNPDIVLHRISEDTTNLDAGAVRYYIVHFVLSLLRGQFPFLYLGYRMETDL